MKSDRQIVDEVFGKIEKYERAKKRRRKILISAVSSCTAACLLCLLALPVFLSGARKGEIPSQDGATAEASESLPGDEVGGDTGAPLPPGSGEEAEEGVAGESGGENPGQDSGSDSSESSDSSDSSDSSGAESANG